MSKILKLIHFPVSVVFFVFDDMILNYLNYALHFDVSLIFLVSYTAVIIPSNSDIIAKFSNYCIAQPHNWNTKIPIGSTKDCLMNLLGLVWNNIQLVPYIWHCWCLNAPFSVWCGEFVFTCCPVKVWWCNI